MQTRVKKARHLPGLGYENGLPGMIPITTPAMVTPATPAPFWERRTVIIEDGCARQTDFPDRDPLDRALDDDPLSYGRGIYLISVAASCR